MILAFDCTDKVPSACLATRDAIVEVEQAAPDESAAEALMPLLERLVHQNGGWTRIGLIALSIGPGGFTGVRVGVATARALALALDCPVLPVGTLEAIAAGLPPVDDLLVVKDVRRDEVVVQTFAQGRPQGQPELLGLSQARERPRAGGLQAAGDGAALLDFGPVLAPTRPMPLAEGVWLAAARRLENGEQPLAGTAIQPYYQRAPDAKIAPRLRRTAPAGQ